MTTISSHYELVLEGSTGKTYNDINYCAFFRCPMVKTSSLIRIRLSMDQIDVKIIKDNIASHNFPKLKLKIYYCNEKDNSKLNLVYQQELQCLNVISPNLTFFKSTDQQMNVDLELVNPILYILSKENKYNTIHEQKTAYDILQDFEQTYLNSRGSGLFSFHHLADDKNRNDYIYKNILVKCPSDLDVPDFLIQTYKINNTLSYYFFDNFYICDKTQSDVTCHYINLDCKDVLTKEDIRKFADKGLLAKPLWDRPITDITDSLNKDNPVVNVDHSEIAFIQNKDPENNTFDTQQKGNVSGFSSGVSGRNMKSVTNKNSLEQQDSNKQKTSVGLITPDKSDNAKSRLELSKKLINETLHGITVYEFTNTFPDFPQFGKIYNLGTDDLSSYVYSPLNIVNIFSRKPSFREPYCQLTNRAVMIKYNS